MLVGLNADEGSAAGEDYRSDDPAKLQTLIRSTYGSYAERAAALYPAATANERVAASVRIRRDQGLAALDAWAMLRSRQARTPVFGYLFAHAEPGAEARRWGAFHSSEIPYVFGTFAASPERPFTSGDQRLSDDMAELWLNFIRRGDPNGPGLPAWPALTNKAPVILRIDQPSCSRPLLPAITLDLMRPSQAQGAQSRSD